MKTYTVTIPTTGYIVYEVKATDEDDAREKIQNSKGKIVEENNGDWEPENEWEIEVEDE